VNDLIQQKFHANPNGASAQIVFVAPHGQKITAARYQPVISEVVAKTARSPQVPVRDHRPEQGAGPVCRHPVAGPDAQELPRHRDGVISTRVGYTGGENDNPTVDNHPGHAEAVQVIFDPERTCYRNILEFFFKIHRPDLGEEPVGSDYRSEIFYTSDEQRQVAEETIADASGFWGGKVMTKVSAAGPFWEAETGDQDYLQRYTDGSNQFSPYRSAAR
jgi:peptide-methionine (S)-S-oxide reductase